MWQGGLCAPRSLPESYAGWTSWPPGRVTHVRQVKGYQTKSNLDTSPPNWGVLHMANNPKCYGNHKEKLNTYRGQVYKSFPRRNDCWLWNHRELCPLEDLHDRHWSRKPLPLKRRRDHLKITWQQMVEKEMQQIEKTWSSISVIAKDRQKWRDHVAALHATRCNGHVWVLKWVSEWLMNQWRLEPVTILVTLKCFHDETGCSFRLLTRLYHNDSKSLKHSWGDTAWLQWFLTRLWIGSLQHLFT